MYRMASKVPSSQTKYFLLSLKYRPKSTVTLYSFLSDPDLRVAVSRVLQKDQNPRPVLRVVIPALPHQTVSRHVVPPPPRDAMVMQIKS